MNTCSPVVCFTNKASCITRYSEGYLHVTWLPGSESSSDMRASMEQLLVELERVPWGKVAADQRNLFPLSTKDSAWLLLDWLPRATKHNLYRYVAILSARDIFCRLAMHSLTLHAQTQFPVVYRLFEEEENAVTWLLAQN